MALFRSTGNATLDEIALLSGAATPELVTEWGVLLGVVMVVSILRTYARMDVNGFRGLSWDDLLVWIGVIFYVALSANGECSSKVSFDVLEYGSLTCLQFTSSAS